MQNSIMHKNNKGQSVWDCPYIKENMKLRFIDKKNKWTFYFAQSDYFYKKRLIKKAKNSRLELLF